MGHHNPGQLCAGLAEEPEEGGAGGDMSVQAWLGGGETALLEQGQPVQVASLLPDGGVHGEDCCLVDLVGVVGQKAEHQPVRFIDMDLQLINRIE